MDDEFSGRYGFYGRRALSLSPGCTFQTHTHALFVSLSHTHTHTCICTCSHTVTYMLLSYILALILHKPLTTCLILTHFHKQANKLKYKHSAKSSQHTFQMFFPLIFALMTVIFKAKVFQPLRVYYTQAPLYHKRVG